MTKPELVEDARGTVEAVARASYGRLLAYLSSETRDVAGAEDALGDALIAALTTWPRDGVPRQPESWLLTAARHRLIDQARRRQVRDAHEGTLQRLADESTATAADGGTFPDRRAELLFVCAHPAIEPALHTPLMLQTVLGVDAARIAQAFLVPPATMGQRLVRAKRKIREAGIPFEVPQEQDLAPRLDAVLEAIYAAYDLGRDEAAGIDPRTQGPGRRGGLARARDRGTLPRRAGGPRAAGPDALLRRSPRRETVFRRPLRPLVGTGSRIVVDVGDPRGRKPSSARRREWDELEGSSSKPPSSRSTSIAPRRGAPIGTRSSASTSTSSGWPPRSEPASRRPPPSPRRAMPRPAWLCSTGSTATPWRRISPSGPCAPTCCARRAETAGAAEAYDRAIGLTEDPAIRQFLLERRGLM